MHIMAQALARVAALASSLLRTVVQMMDERRYAPHPGKRLRLR
ncbi:hypothetical protein [Chloroflexus sp.]